MVDKKIKIDWEQTEKQTEAWFKLTDKTTTEILYGGGAGGGKSFLGCAWLLISAIKYPGTRYLMGRSELKRLKQSTLKTFLSIGREWGLSHLYDYNLYQSLLNSLTRIRRGDYIQHPL